MGLEVDDKGLFIYADLSKTSRSRQLYEDIQSGNVSQMSIRCRASTSFDGDTQIIERIEKMIDVSAVSLPANDHTRIVARTIEAFEEAEREKKRKALLLKIKIEGEI